MAEENEQPPIILYFFGSAILIICGYRLFLKCIYSTPTIENSHLILNENENQNQNEIENIEVTNILHTNDIITELEHFSIIPDMNTIKHDEECIICTESLSEKQIRILKCTHKFHQECIDSWISVSQKLECPVCCMNITQLDDNVV